ncbi:MAG: SUMF1/EgtB/PvdO family nonheme iron enzyme [Chloroflexi bacterium]|nr:SUMF1/EgtB/PvdO family nonheme iron enzyme [Chloroflexota bacterium]
MNDDLQHRLTQLKQAYESGILDKDTYQAAVAALTTAPAPPTAVQSGAAAQGDDSQALGQQAVNVEGDVGRDVITGNVYYGQPAADPAAALRIYRRVLVQGNAHLPLRGVDIGASDPTRAQSPLGLANVYVNLDTTTQVRAEKGADTTNRPATAATEQEMRPLPALEAAAGERSLVLLGDPGGGKSAFVNHIAHCLAAHVLYPEADWRRHLAGWPAEEASALPLVVILRDFAHSLPDKLPRQATPTHLWRFIEARLDAQNLGFAAAPIQRALEDGEALVLLDGLDEVPSSAQRAFVRDATERFTERYPDNRYLVTCRSLSYQDKALRLSENRFPIYELAPFDEAKIDRFVRAWYDELARVGSVEGTKVEGLTRQFQKAIRRPDLWRLAPNPLLLTVMALVNTHKGRLPDARAMLYEDTVEMLLWRWEQIKVGDKESVPRLRQLLLAAGRSAMDLKRMLWRLAYEAHAETSGGDKLADIDELKLRQALAALKAGDWNWADAALAAMKLRAGLLLERAPGVFTFPHRTFQEYLAGCHLAAQGDFAQRAAKLAEHGADWREAILLAVGRLVYLAGDMDKPLNLANRLCPTKGADTNAAWEKAWLAGEALHETGLTRVREDAWGAELSDRIRLRLANLIDGGKLTPRQRTEAGDTLARLGDPRRGVDVVMTAGDALPDIELCYVPPGPFWMGGGDDDQHARDNEKPLRLLDIPYGYWIGRYPVTVAQFKAFMTHSGHKLQGSFGRNDDPDNRPARYVTWHDALAFCRWLDGIWRERGWLPDGYGVLLPSEAEWEKAARGGREIPVKAVAVTAGDDLVVNAPIALTQNPAPQRMYPWGANWDAQKGNGKETGLETTCAVGAFPGGAGPYGTLDMSGNVYDWTRTVWGNEYPYEADDGRENLESHKGRVIRGGAFYSNASWLRCAFRGYAAPHLADDGVGFRVVASPFIPPTSGR